MQKNNQEWEGFQSFGDDISPFYSNIGVAKHHNNINSEPTIAEMKMSQTQIRARTFHKKLFSFKTNKRTKYSVAQIEDPKKKVQKRNMSTPKPLYKNHSVSNQKEECKESPPKHKEDHIPIYRFPIFSQAGKLIYKGFLPTSATDYLSYSEYDLMRRGSPGMAADQKEITFNSKFESGNLDIVRRVNSQYHLYIAPDTNTRGHRQWFYFTVSSQKDRKIRIIIHGFKKPFSLFEKGMQPYGKKVQETDQAWKPIGSNVQYQKQQPWLTEKRIKTGNRKGSPEYCLTFFLNLEGKATYCIASCIPYTYSFLNEQLMEFHKSKTIVPFKQTTLCKTLLGLQIPLLTFNEKQDMNHQGYRYIIINARSHPGESSSSWVAQGIMDYLFEVQAQALIKKHKIVIKVVPMLNPDGVLMGNYRTGLMGIDFNRLFLSASPNIFPQIEALKSLVRSCKNQGKVDLYMDLHGHSINPGCFFYGPDQSTAPSSDLRQIGRKFKNSLYFSRKHCMTGSNSAKAQTSRVYFQLHEGVYSLTCENSLGLYYKDDKGYYVDQFSIADWKQFGFQMMKNILEEYRLRQKEKQRFPYEKFMYTQHLKVEQTNGSQIKRYKTDVEEFTEQLKKLQYIDSEDIEINSPLKPIRKSQDDGDLDSLNDSDNESDDLGSNRLEQLFNIVNHIVGKRGEANGTNTTHRKWWFRDRYNRNQQKGQAVGNFKQYRFGYEDSTLSDWIAKKRMLSIPKALKQQKVNNTSYIIRKSAPKPPPNELIFQSFDLYHRVRTQERQNSGFKMHSKINGGSKNNSFREKY